MVMVVVEDVCLKYHGHMYYLLAVYFIMPELFVVVDYCCHGDGSGGVHLYTKYITTRTNILIHCLRPFVVAMGTWKLG